MMVVAVVGRSGVLWTPANEPSAAYVAARLA